MSPPTNAGRLVILSGPSCVGKSPLVKALGRFFPELRAKMRTIVLYNSRQPRPGERNGVDYHLRSRRHIEELDRDDRYVVMDVRGDLQALDLDELESLVHTQDALFEGNPFVGRALQVHPRLAHVPRLSIYLAPLSKEEIRYLQHQPDVSLADLVTDVMRRKLLVRTRRQKKELSLRDLENIERRAGSAYRELQEAHHFDYVIPNHDGEDSDNWDAFYYPIGDARRALLSFVSLLEGREPTGIEKWEADLLP